MAHNPCWNLVGLALFTLVGSACAVDRPETAGFEQDIVGGQVASPTQFPTVIAVEDAFLGVPFCSGTLIDRSWVVTAAHCIRPPGAGFDFGPGDLQIIFDDPDVSDLNDGSSATIAAIHVHPDYDERIPDHDIALVKLRKPVTNRAATPIARTTIPPGTSVTIVGYGVDDGSLLPGALHSLATRNSDCAAVGQPEISNANLLCFDHSSGAGTSDGDSGGPTFIEAGGVRTVVGVTSDAAGHFDTNTLVPHELAFIDQFVPIVQAHRADVPDPGPSSDPVGGGCAVAGGLDGGWLLAAGVGLMAVARRRRRITVATTSCRLAAPKTPAAKK